MNSAEKLSLPSRKKTSRTDAAILCLLACAISLILCGAQYLHIRQSAPMPATLMTRTQPARFVPDTSAKTILLTGDSMGDGLSLELRRLGRQNRVALVYVPWYSSTTRDWSENDTLRKLIRRYHPALVLFSLGSNELLIPAIRTRERFVVSIVRQLQDVPSVWIGPPNWKEDTGINALIDKHLDSLHFFQSKALRFERMTDGAHPTFRASALWADTLVRWMDSNPVLGMHMKIHS
jgi:hypothetical protein